MIRTIYLVPHSHTDLGYSHDPVVAIELHDRFLDRAIVLCEQTRDWPEGTQFRWTVEVFFSALHWWEHRGEVDRRRFCVCLARGEIAIGARYLNGTELYSPGDVAWELAQLERLARLTGYRPNTAVQNDVNGFPLAFARPLAEAGVGTLLMGLNTTMGHSPFPRCSAFGWQVAPNRELLVWNGWIYNRIKTFCHLDRLADAFPAAIDAFLASLPADYPYDFAMTSATMGDNAGPFVSLPEQVRQYNAREPRVRLELVTADAFAQVLHRQPAPRRAHAGNWPDFWTFGAGALPQMAASLRRAQRRLRLVDAIRDAGWAHADGGTLTADRARAAVAAACEHTYDSHTSSGVACGSSDALRQKAQILSEAAIAESAAMVLLRDHLAAIAADQPRTPVAVLSVNPHEHPLRSDYLTQEKGMLQFATSRQPEHLFQFDREPTHEALAAAGTFGATDIVTPPRSVSRTPLQPLTPQPWLAADPTADLTLRTRDSALTWNATAAGVLSWTGADGRERLATQSGGPSFACMEERPVGRFQISGLADLDPADCAWNPALCFERRPVPGRVTGARRWQTGSRAQLEVEWSGGPLTGLSFDLDDRAPDRLRVSARWHFDADPTQRAYYLALPLALPGAGECAYWVDGCGVWFEAERGQLPGTCTSFYQAYSGVAVSRGGATVYVVAADTTLFQFGGFTFGQAPAKPLQRRDPFVALWIYNNYWGTNFPSYSPGLLESRFVVACHSGAFDPAVAASIDTTFDADYLSHPLA